MNSGIHAPQCRGFRMTCLRRWSSPMKHPQPLAQPWVHTIHLGYSSSPSYHDFSPRHTKRDQNGLAAPLGLLSCSPHLGCKHVCQAIGGSVECEAPDQVDDEYEVRRRCGEIDHLWTHRNRVSLNWEEIAMQQ